jgi:hypothetical protein
MSELQSDDRAIYAGIPRVRKESATSSPMREQLLGARRLGRIAHGFCGKQVMKITPLSCELIAMS